MPDHYPRIYLSRSIKEWEFVEKKLKEMGTSSVFSHLLREIPPLENDFKCCPERFSVMSGKRSQKQFYLPPNINDLLSEISEKSGVDRGIIVNRLIIEPLLILP